MGAKRVTFADLVGEIRTAVSNGKGTFGIGHSTMPADRPPFVLILGSRRAVTCEDEVLESRVGFIVSLGLTQKQVEDLRDHCTQLLKEHEGPKAEGGKPS